MSENDGNTNPKEGTITIGPWALPESIQSALGYAAFAYAVGFITLLVHTARYGVPIFEFVEPINLWVGAVPTAAIVGGIMAFRKWKKMKGVDAPVSVLKVLKDLRLLALLAAGSNLGGWAGYFGIYLAVRSGIGTTPETQWLDDAAITHRQGFLWVLSFCSLGVIVFRTDWESFNESAEHAQYYVRYLISGITAAILVLYVWVLFPVMPQRYGFGQPIPVQLVLEKEVPIESLKLTPSGDGKPDSRPGETVWKTGQIELLFRTADEYVVRAKQDNDSQVISIDTKSVKAVRWF